MASGRPRPLSNRPRPKRLTTFSPSVSARKISAVPIRAPRRSRTFFKNRGISFSSSEKAASTNCSNSSSRMCIKQVNRCSRFQRMTKESASWHISSLSNGFFKYNSRSVKPTLETISVRLASEKAVTMTISVNGQIRRISLAVFIPSQPGGIRISIKTTAYGRPASLACRISS